MALDRRTFFQGSAFAAIAATWPTIAQQQTAAVPVTIDTRQVIGSLSHIWKECAGSDRAAITLRESWRQPLQHSQQAHLCR